MVDLAASGQAHESRPGCGRCDRPATELLGDIPLCDDCAIMAHAEFGDQLLERWEQSRLPEVLSALFSPGERAGRWPRPPFEIGVVGDPRPELGG
jgi:hypothetical protein